MCKIFDRYARYSICYIFTSFPAKKSIFSPIINYSATFVSQMFKKTYKLQKNLKTYQKNVVFLHPTIATNFTSHHCHQYYIPPLPLILHPTTATNVISHHCHQCYNYPTTTVTIVKSYHCHQFYIPPLLPMLHPTIATNVMFPHLQQPMLYFTTVTNVTSYVPLPPISHHWHKYVISHHCHQCYIPLYNRVPGGKGGLIASTYLKLVTLMVTKRTNWD